MFPVSFFFYSDAIMVTPSGLEGNSNPSIETEEKAESGQEMLERRGSGTKMGSGGQQLRQVKA